MNNHVGRQESQPRNLTYYRLPFPSPRYSRRSARLYVERPEEINTRNAPSYDQFDNNDYLEIYD